MEGDSERGHTGGRKDVVSPEMRSRALRCYVCSKQRGGHHRAALPMAEERDIRSNYEDVGEFCWDIVGFHAND